MRIPVCRYSFLFAVSLLLLGASFSSAQPSPAQQIAELKQELEDLKGLIAELQARVDELSVLAKVGSVGVVMSPSASEIAVGPGAVLPGPGAVFDLTGLLGDGFVAVPQSYLEQLQENLPSP